MAQRLMGKAEFMDGDGGQASMPPSLRAVGANLRVRPGLTYPPTRLRRYRIKILIAFQLEYFIRYRQLLHSHFKNLRRAWNHTTTR